MNRAIPVYTISLPEYRIEPQTDWLAVGRKLDGLIQTSFPEKRIAIRCVGLIDHPGRSLDDLVAIILETGTDRYDPLRKGVHPEFYRDVTDIFAGPAIVTADGLQTLRAGREPIPSVMGETVELFFDGTLADRGYSIRLDILMIYALDQLEGEDVLYRFKYPDRKQEALLGVIKILRE
jgi:hypothetical protein